MDKAAPALRPQLADTVRKGRKQQPGDHAGIDCIFSGNFLCPGQQAHELCCGPRNRTERRGVRTRVCVSSVPRFLQHFEPVGQVRLGDAALFRIPTKNIPLRKKGGKVRSEAQAS